MSSRREQLHGVASHVRSINASVKEAAFKDAMARINKQLDEAAARGLFSCEICAEVPLRKGFEERGSYKLDSAEFITMQNTLIDDGFQVVGSTEIGEKYKNCMVNW